MIGYDSTSLRRTLMTLHEMYLEGMQEFHTHCWSNPLFWSALVLWTGLYWTCVVLKAREYEPTIGDLRVAKYVTDNNKRRRPSS